MKSVVLALVLLQASFSWSAAIMNNIDEVVQLEAGKKYFVSTESVKVRSSNDIDRNNSLGLAQLNDTIELVEVPSEDSTLAAVRVLKSSSFKDPNTVVYISKKFLTTQDLLKKVSPYFVIQNIATEVTRVYKRCDTSPGCPHQMIFEANTVVGRPEEGTDENDNAFKTKLGHGRIYEWIKFYQDTEGHYPHWYKAGQDMSTIPPRAPLDDGKPEFSLSWGKKWRKEVNGEKTMYGAFGWYAAKIYPGPTFSFQWIHGTIGWGSDEEAAIEMTRSALLNIFSNPGSSGCTRVSNGTIAYLRSLLPVGTDIFRVYAREGTREKTCLKEGFFGGCKKENIFSRYANQVQPKPWNFVMVTDGAQQSGGVSADPGTLALLGISAIDGKNVIERGTFMADQYPNPRTSDYNYEPSTGKTGDRYMIDDKHGNKPTNFQGLFVVDEGRFVNYQHPKHKNIVISGLPQFRKAVPAYLQTQGSAVPAEVKHSYRNSKSNDY